MDPNNQRRYIPAKRLSDNALGFYETIHGNFLTNSGSGAFIAGPTASGHGVPSGYQELQYIESTGGEYILTDFYPDHNTDIEVKYELTGLGVPSGRSVCVFGIRAKDAYTTSSTRYCEHYVQVKPSSGTTIGSNNIIMGYGSTTDVYTASGAETGIHTVTRITKKRTSDRCAEESFDGVFKRRILFTANKDNDYIFLSQLPLYIFCTRFGSSTGSLDKIQNFMQGRIYYLVINCDYESGRNLYYDGNQVSRLIYNGTEVQHLYRNGSQVF